MEYGLHQERAVHARNFDDLPLWGLVFGALHNPHRFEGRAGFDGKRSQRLTDRLLMRDVHLQPARPAHTGRRRCGQGAAA